MVSSTGKPTNGKGSTPVQPRASPQGAATTAAVRDLHDSPPPSTRSITDRTGGYEPPDGEFDSPRVYVNCSWCSGGGIHDETATHIGVFGSLASMAVWDVRLCVYHADNVSRRNPRPGEPIWAPLHFSQPNEQGYYADEWLIEKA